MYLYDRQLTGAERQCEERSITLRPSQRFFYSEEALRNPFSQFSYPFGEPAAAPKGLILLDHIHTPKHPRPFVPGSFVVEPPAKLDLKNMNPLFINSKDQIIADTSSSGLQTCLQKLITTQFQNYLAQSQNTAPAAGDRLRVALVDLTGAKITKPDFAGWGATVSMYGASVPKILPLYAAHQLRRDLRNLAADQKITNGKKLAKTAVQNWKSSGIKRGFPDLVWLFDIPNWSGASDLDFSGKARNALNSISENCPAGELIARIGFPYIGSVTRQSGLHHPTRGGLWLRLSYCKKGSWSGNPIKGVHSHNVTALSAATYFTLLAQGRLVDDASSNEMKNSLLVGGCITGLFPDSLKLGLAAAKCGIYSKSHHLHDCALIVRDDVRYVVAGLTITKPSEFSKYTQLFLELDKLIVRNNQKPKPSC